jgi:hypothetical protein
MCEIACALAHLMEIQTGGAGNGVRESVRASAHLVEFYGK